MKYATDSVKRNGLLKAAGEVGGVWHLWETGSKPRSTTTKIVSTVVEWLRHRAHDQHGLGSKPTHAILLCPWERHFTALSLLGGLGKQF